MRKLMASPGTREGGPMAKNPSSIFYWVDWTSDLALRKCSAAAQGMWMQMLAIAAEAGGYVKVGDDPCSICDLAEITGWDKRNVSKWVRELERKGVSSRTEDGVIYCRRMVREAEARAAKRGKGVSGVRRTKASARHPQQNTNQPDLLDNPSPKSQKCTPSYSDSVAVSQTPTPNVDKPESLNAARATETSQGEGGKNEGMVSKQRCALSEDLVDPPLAAKTRMPAELVSRHRDGENDEEASSTPTADNRRAAAIGKCKNQIKTLRRWSQHSPHLPDEERGHRLAMLTRAAEANNRDAWVNRSDEDKACYDLLAAKAARLPLDEQTLAWIRMAERPEKGGLWRRSKTGANELMARELKNWAQTFAQLQGQMQ